MAFGGSIKLTGESDYRKAIKEITNNLKVLSSEMKVVNSSYDKNDNSVEALASRNKILNDVLSNQAKKVSEAEKAFNEMNKEIENQNSKHQELQNKYNQEKATLDGLKSTLGETSKEYVDQKKVVDELSDELQTSSKNQDLNASSLTRMQITLNNAKAEYNKTSKEIENNNKAIKEQENATDKAEDSLDEMNKTLKNTENAVEKAKDGFTVMKGALANLISQGISKAIDGLKEFSKSMITTSATIKAENSKFEQTFGDMADKATEAINRVANETGIIDTRLKDTASNIYAFARSSGAEVPEALELMETALRATADSAAYYDKSLEESAETLQSFLKGNYANDAALGVSATEMTRNAKATELFGKKYKDLSEIQKQKTLLKMVTDSQKLSGAMGQASRETDGFENVTGNLKETWRQFKAQVGTPFLEALIPIIKKVTEGFKNWAKSVDWKKFSNTVKGAVEVIQNVFKWFVDNMHVIVGAIGGIIAAFATAKILAFGSAVTTFLKTIMSAPTIIQGVTTAMKALNATTLANPWILLASAIAGVVAALAIWIGSSDEAVKRNEENKKAIEQERDAIIENKNAYDELNKKKQETINQGFTEIEHYKALYDELTTLVNENGRVKEGYEGRAKFITDTLANALGVEISMTDGVVKGYKKLKDSIDAVIEKKKAQIVLDAQEQSYKEAITKRMEAMTKLNELEDALEIKRAERDRVRAMRDAETNEIAKRAFDESVKRLDEQISAQETAYNTQEDLLKQYAYNIGQYEQNMALFHQEKYSEMNTVNWESVKNLQDTGDLKKAQLEQQIRDEKDWLEQLKTQRNDGNAEIYDAQIKASEKQITKLQEDLKSYTSTINTGNEEADKAWLDGIAKQLSTILGKQYEFKDAGDGQVQTYVDSVQSGQPQAEETMKKFINAVIKQVEDKKMDAKFAGLMILKGIDNGLTDEQQRNLIEKNGENVGEDILNAMKTSVDAHSPSREAEKIGKYVLEGTQKGIDNRDKRNSIFRSISSFGNSLLGSLRNTLAIASPSKKTKQIGEYLIEGLGVGIENEEDDVIKEVNKFGENVVGTLQSQLNNQSLNADLGVKDIDLNNSLNKSISFANKEDRFGEIVGAFKEALTQVKVEMDDEPMGKFVDKTVANAIYN